MGRRPPGEKLRFSKFLYVGDFVDGAMPSLAFYRIFVITPSQTSLRVAIPNIRYIPAGCDTSSAKSLARPNFHRTAVANSCHANILNGTLPNLLIVS